MVCPPPLSGSLESHVLVFHFSWPGSSATIGIGSLRYRRNRRLSVFGPTFSWGPVLSSPARTTHTGTAPKIVKEPGRIEK